MAVQSVFGQAKELGAQVGGILSGYDVMELPANDKALVSTIKRQLVDVRLDVRDYEYAQTRAQQLQASKEGRERLKQLEQYIIRASEHDLFGAVDVAQLSARIEQIISYME